MKLKRMKARGNDELFIKFQQDNYENFIFEIIGECDLFSGIEIYNGFMFPKPCLGNQLNMNNPYIDIKLINTLFDTSMGNLSSLWWN